MPRYVRSPAPNPIPLANLGRFPLYRIKIPPDFLDLLVGATLGNRYVVLSVIGRGGMSVVYKAKEMSTGEVVAVKTLRTHSLTDEMVVKRFQREAELLSRLNHPRIVNLHAYGTSARGQPYFVMDFLVGDNLVTVLKREDHLDAERFQDIFVQVCAAIEHAHKHGAIHRDIKPGNIMLTRTRRTKDYVKVVDFGIAKLAEEAQKLTRMGEVWGSPIYMSPEQCMGAPLDARSDIYSLGIVMYEALTGRVPFLGRNYADTMGKQISETPPTFAEIRPEVSIPGTLEEIVMKALAKDAADRYQSLTEMRKDLESALSAQQTTTPQPLHPAMSGSLGNVNKASKTNNQLKSPRDSISPRASASKIKVADRRESDNSFPRKLDGRRDTSQDLKKNSSSQSRSNLRPQTIPDMERPRKHSSTRPRLDAAVINPHRVRNLILIAAGSLLITGGLIAVFTNGPQVASVVAMVLKQIIGGGDDPNQDHGPLDTPNTMTTDSQSGATGSGVPLNQQDPQQALKDWLTPGGQAGGDTALSTSSDDQGGYSQATSSNDDSQQAEEESRRQAEEQSQTTDQR
jgi:serine/threonine protein kinase